MVGYVSSGKVVYFCFGEGDPLWKWVWCFSMFLFGTCNTVVFFVWWGRRNKIHIWYPNIIHSEFSSSSDVTTLFSWCFIQEETLGTFPDFQDHFLLLRNLEVWQTLFDFRIFFRVLFGSNEFCINKKSPQAVCLGGRAPQIAQQAGEDLLGGDRFHWRPEMVGFEKELVGF